MDKKKTDTAVFYAAVSAITQYIAATDAQPRKHKPEGVSGSIQPTPNTDVISHGYLNRRGLLNKMKTNSEVPYGNQS